MKYFFCFLLIYLLPVGSSLYAQTTTDSVSQVVLDSAVEETVDSATETSDEEIGPVSDSSFHPAVPVRSVSNRMVRSYSGNPDYAYANDPEYWKKVKPRDPGNFFAFLRNPLFRYILLIIVVGVVIWGIYRLILENGFNVFSRKKKSAIGGDSPLIAEEQVDFDEAIRRYQAEGNYRMAVRYQYLRLIRQVREHKNWLLPESATNADFIRAFGTHPDGSEFRMLTNAYEYIFYGGFSPQPALYSQLQSRFESLNKKLAV